MGQFYFSAEMFYLLIFYFFFSSGLNGEVDQPGIKNFISNENQHININFVFIAVTSVDVDFETVRDGLANGSITYLDVRSWMEVETYGRIVGSFVIPRKLFII